MLLRGTFLGCVLMLIMMSMPAPSGDCTIEGCHNISRCQHFQPRFGGCFLADELSATGYFFVSQLKGGGGLVPSGLGGSDYQRANLLVYFIGLPLIALIAAIVLKQSPWLIGATVCVLAGMLIQGMHFEAAPALYMYGTEFCVRLGNLTGLTYWGICILIFVLGIPLCALWDVGHMAVVVWSKLKKPSYEELEAAMDE